MIAFLQKSADRFLGRGDAAITVPPMDGPLKPNHIIDNAEVVAELIGGSDLATDGQTLWVAQGRRVFKLGDSNDLELVTDFPEPITALAFVPKGGLVVVLGGRALRSVDRPEWSPAPRTPGGKALTAITAVSPMADGALLVSEGSAKHSTDDWARDLLMKGNTGRICALYDDPRKDRDLATDLQYAFGVCEIDGAIWASESWAHQVLRLDPAAKSGAAQTLIGRLPAYPSRITPAAGGGAWVTMIAARRRLIEFVLREDRYRKAMMAQVDPRYWVAPMLSSGNSFREPLQGGNVKVMGISKPWAPPRSYGLVVRLGANGLPAYSLHSRADGHHHGIVSAVEVRGHLYLLSKGADLLLRIPLDGIDERAS